MTENRQVLIDSLPKDQLSESNYRIESNPVPEPQDGEVLCRTLVLTIGAGTRAGLQGSASYAGAPKTNVVMNGTGVARVELSNSPELGEGDLVVCPSGWQDYSIHKASRLTKVTDDIDPAHYLGALGTNGLTAYFGLLSVGEPEEGETVLVSAAAGSVGHLVGQIAKIKGCKTVGITSTVEKCHLLQDQLGYDASVSYRSADFRAELKEACPNGVDVYFDNTGGEILGNALFRMNEHSRIVCCGVVSQYDTSNPAGGPRGIPGLLVNKRIRMEGFLVFDYIDQYESGQEEIKAWIKSGELDPLNDEFEGLERAPSAFVDLLAGGNVGTRIVRVAE
ncbi:MAG TPA: NADP-dependent oxidoreductase [Pseudomonadales bacterium]|nr:NADP-dependent oxidoreductase [Pseudomonadales bacterium]MDP7451321.1 NADP-dependent oxidoreductase [Arenicellales bacterium]MDP6317233.1 NADP-dependent oxidoreductase [Pseudomonadales bacterium]MDP7314108.1 NADP-dependent oxidoreductase [Pseudomonadales bacterium]MDP7576031.1 NADP-dependent oxidoreductase [Pseudomonadales bacterium]